MPSEDSDYSVVPKKKLFKLFELFLKNRPRGCPQIFQTSLLF